jgi:TonB-linked SusC/RagA family outer membrane protein
MNSWYRHLVIWMKINLSMKKVLLSLLAFLCFHQLDAQQIIKGKVKDDTNLPLPGVSIQVKNTLRGTFTEVDGSFSISAGENDTLIFSMVGMVSQRVAVGNRTVLDIKLLTETTLMDEIIVIGYGSQRVKDLTAPIVSIKGDELSKQITSNPMQALQGKVAGVQIINSGIPGGGSSVKIRGVGSIGDYANPLYIVDGTFVDNIDFLSSGDIEDLTILKDASASAIYGVRAANGVILVTTKKGRTEKPVISYDGYFGLQVPVNIMPMSTKDQYVTLLNEANANATGYIPKDPAAYPVSTDWYKKLVRVAPTNNHSLDISGTNDRTSYSVGGSYFFQEGIMNIKNDYRRYNFRGRLDQKVNDFLKIGINSVISRYGRNIPNDGAFFGAYVNPPVYPVYDATNTSAYPVKFGSPQTYGFGNQYGNPVAAAYYTDNVEKGFKLVFSTFAEFNIVQDKLTYKLAYNTDQNFWNSRNYTPEFNVGGSQGVRKSSLSKTSGSSSKQIIDNLITYRDKIDQHSFSFLLGQSTRMEKWESLSGSAIDVPGFDEQSKYLVNGSFKDRYAWDGAAANNGLSFFTRGTYNYDDKYLATFTFRADASSKYQEKWGYFPSVGFGWVLSREAFMADQKMFDYLKFRASWGLLGNDNVPANSAVILGQTGPGSSGIFGDVLVDGVGAQTVVQNYLKWEVVNEFDFGFDFTLLKNKLSGEIDYYHRVTNNVVFYAPIATGGGVAELLGNNGSVLNHGVELNLNWKRNLNKTLSYNIGFNATTIFNKVLKLQGRDYIPGAMVRGNFSTRTQVGHPIGSFYGYEISGVYKTEAEALLDPVNQTIKDKGYFKYKDQNGDNVIDENDKVFLGSAIPWLIAGIDFGLNNKHFDLSIGLQGQVGNKILNAKRMNRDVFTDGNYDKDFYDNRWTPNKISDKYPSAEAYNYSFIQQANDFFVESGSYVRIQNIQIGYTTEKIKFIPKLRIYISSQRPFTIFTYKGFTPEVGGTPISSGIDNSVYPMQSIYTLGLKMNF